MTIDYIMNYSLSTPPYDYQQHHHHPQHDDRQKRIPLKRMLESIDQHHKSSVNQSTTTTAVEDISQPPDLLHDSEEEDEDSLGTPSLSPKQGFFNTTNLICNNKNGSYSHDSHRRRKSVPHRSPSIVSDAFHQTSSLDKSVVFQLNVQPTNNYAANQSCPDCGLKCSSKIICGQSLLSSLRKSVAYARSLNQHKRVLNRRDNHNKHTHKVSFIRIPRQQRGHGNNRASFDPVASTNQATNTAAIPHKRPWDEESRQYHYQRQQSQHHDKDGDEDEQDHQVIKPAKKSRRQSSTTHGSSSGRPSRVKGPCQACQEASDGCMRKAFNWPFPASQIFNDKGKPFVYLCNKCGLRYNKSGGCVCRNCRWVFCKEEKRKALQHVDAMRRKRPDGHIDPNEDIENFVCSPKYWTCGKPWKVGWVLNNLEDDETYHIVSSPASSS